jgi:coenzyme F420-0:L-glutamate ligase/coenzyme F420-1:gamma-L-glutamate ligase
MPLILTPLANIPLISPGDDLARIIIESAGKMDLTIQDGAIFVIAQKVISKSENRLVNLNDVKPGSQAIKIALECEKDPRLVELILTESNCILRKKPGTIIVEHRLGFVCANAGIDHSNVKGSYGRPEDWVLLLPRDPDDSAEKIRSTLQLKYQVTLGVLIIDSHGRAWRNGIMGASIGMSGVPGVVDLRGTPDLFDYSLRITQVGAADELAAAASLVMGQADEGTPIVHVHGFPYALRDDSSIKELIRDIDKDLFR